MVAVLLDEFIKAVEAEKVHKRELDLQERPSSDEKGALDPLLSFIVNFNTSEEQEQKADLVFDRMCQQAEELERSCDHESGRHEVDIRVICLPALPAVRLYDRHLYLWPHLHGPPRRFQSIVATPPVSMS